MYCQNHIKIKLIINYYAVQNFNVLWKSLRELQYIFRFFPSTLGGYNSEKKHFWTHVYMNFFSYFDP